MHVTILGGAGFLGRKVARRLAAEGALGGRPVSSLTLFDLAAPEPVEAPLPMRCLGGDISGLPLDAIPPETEVVFHLAAVVCAAAEADYELGRRVNVLGTDAVLRDGTRQVPANSCGAQKAAAELFLADASRRGFLDAVLIRLPTVIVRPGRPNKAASSFVSGILREPLLGLPAELPVADGFALWVCGARWSGCCTRRRWTRGRWDWTGA